VGIIKKDGRAAPRGGQLIRDPVVGEALRRMRERLHLTQRQLAAGVGVSQMCISIAERGGPVRPTVFVRAAGVLLLQAAEKPEVQRESGV
jgi:predicted transcriptional regulator